VIHCNFVCSHTESAQLQALQEEKEALVCGCVLCDVAGFQPCFKNLFIQTATVTRLTHDLDETRHRLHEVSEHTNAYSHLVEKSRADTEVPITIGQLHSHAHVVPLIRTQVISKALSQNKELKLQLIELQDRFVALTNDGMERASELQTVQHQRSANS
jgi:hypothetical protein